MAKKLTDDQLNFILNINGNQAQEEIRKFSAANRDLETSNNSLRVAMAKLEAQGRSNSDEYKQLNTTLSANNSQISQNKLMVTELTKQLGLTDMTMNQLRKQAQQLQGQLNNTSKSLDPEAYANLETKLNAVKSRMGELTTKTKETHHSLFSIVSIGSAVGNAISNFFESGIEKAKEFINESIEIAEKASGIKRGFDNLNQPDLLDKLQEATENTVDKISLMSYAMKADPFKIPMSQLITMLQYAKKRADDTGDSFDALANRIIEAFGTKLPRSFVQLGISVNELRKKTKETGDVGSAAMIILNEELRKSANYTDTAQDKTERYEATLTNFKLSVGNFLLPLKSALMEWSTSLIKGVEDLTAAEKPATEQMKDQLNVVSNLSVHISPLVNRYDELTKKTKLNKTEHQELKDIIKQVTDEIPGAASAFDKYGNAIAISTSYARDFVNQQVASLKYLHADAYKKAQEDVKRYGEEAKKAQEELQKSTQPGYQWTISEYVSGGQFSPMQSVSRAATQEEIAQSQKKDREAIARYNTALDALKYFEGSSLKEMQNANDKKVQMQDKFNKMTKEQLAQYIKENKDANDEYVKMAKEIYNARYAQTDNKNAGGNTGKTAQQKEMEALDLEKQKEENALKEKYAKGLISQVQYENQVLKLEQDTLMKQLAIAGLEPAKRQEIWDKILDARIKMNNEMSKLEVNLTKSISGDLDTMTKNAGNSLSELSKKLKANSETDLEDYIKKKQEMINITLSVANSTGEIVGGVISNNQNAIKSGLEGIVNLALDALKAQVEIAAVGVTAQSLAQPDSILSFGATGLARATIIIGLIEGAFDAAKSVVNSAFSNSSNSISSKTTASSSGGQRVLTGFSDGGYTGNGQRYDVAGVVHRGEYVVAQPEMRNPAVISYVRAIENVRNQRSNNNSLPDDIGYSDGGYTGSKSVNNIYASDPELKAILKQHVTLLNFLANNGVNATLDYRQTKKKLDLLNKSNQLGTRS